MTAPRLDGDCLAEREAYPPLPKATSWQIAIMRAEEDGDTIVGWRDEFSETSFNFSRQPKRTMFTAEQLRAYVDADRASRAALSTGRLGGEAPSDVELIEAMCARIKAADDAMADNDYMLDSNDCISVLRGTWTAPLANDYPPAPAAQPQGGKS